MKKKKLTSLLLALLMVLPAFAAGCSESSENNTDTKDATNVTAADNTAVDAGDTAETEFTRAMVKDDLPDDLDFGGQEQIILARTKAWFEGEMFVEELNGETLNDAVYNRDITVENRLNCVINYNLQADTNGVVNKNVTAGKLTIKNNMPNGATISNIKVITSEGTQVSEYPNTVPNGGEQELGAYDTRHTYTVKFKARTTDGKEHLYAYTLNPSISLNHKSPTTVYAASDFTEVAN